MTRTLDDLAEARPLIVADEPSDLLMKRTTETWASLHAIISIAVIVFMLEVSSAIAITPQIQILEAIVCEKYYDRTSLAILHPSNDQRCKTEPIQTEVALINGWKNTFEMVPGILLAFPYGFIADRIGRKKLTLLAMLGCLLSDSWVRLICWYADKIPLRYIWLSGLWQIVGGGPPTFTSLLFVMAAQSTSAKNRIVAFSFLNVAALAAEILTVPTSGYLMSFGPWIPFMLAPALTILTIVVTVLLLPSAVGDRSSNHEISETLDPRPSDACFQSSHTVQSSSWFTRAGKSFVIASIFFTSSLGGQSMGLLLQYSAKKFSWTFAKASWIITLRAAISFIVLTTIIPGASTMIAKYARHTTSRTKDKRLAQTSCLLLLIGSMTIFFAASPALIILGTIIAALGFSFNVTAKSFVTALVAPDDFGAVYTGITVATYGGLLSSGPLFAHTFHCGLQLGGLWMGLLFLVASGLFLLCLVTLSLADGF